MRIVVNMANSKLSYPETYFRMQYAQICPCINALFGMKMTLVLIGLLTMPNLFGGGICHGAGHENMNLKHPPQQQTPPAVR